MQTEKINGVYLHRLFLSGYRNLKKNMNVVNELNVFPVPDGDTGTNMVHTIGAALNSSNTDIESVSDYMKNLSRAVLLSARGNSGVILSQFIHGLMRGFSDKDEIAFCDFYSAFDGAVEDSYKAIMTPTEGTILTVIRVARDFLKKRGDSFADFKSGFEALVSNMKTTLATTPDLLPVLREAGVVDSGGAGLICIFEGMLAELRGIAIEDTPDIVGAAGVAQTGNFGPDSQLEYGYCTEFILQLMNYKTDIGSFSKDEFVKPLSEMGNSIVAVQNDDIVKIHIHTFTPEMVLMHARKYGEFVTLKIENMSVQHSEITEATEKREKVKYAVVTVASGEGLIDYFYSIGASAVINGGQTSNPSVDDFIKAFKRFDAEHIIVLPNNKNIILAANQAAEMYDETDVRVIPTCSVVEGYSALSMMNLWSDTVDELIADMSSGLDSVISASVTTATRDTVMNGVEIEKGKYIGIKNKEILLCSSDREELAFELIRTIMEQDEKEVIILFCGAAVSETESGALCSRLEDEYPLADIGVIRGEQDVYDYIISLE